MPINGAIHSACTAVSRAISNWWTAGFVLSASHKIPKGALMAICNLQRQVMIFHILRRSGFGSKLSSLIISIGSTRNMADFMEKWRLCWNGSVCVDPSDGAHASVPHSVTNICCSSFMAIVIQLKLDFPSSLINWRCVINRQRQASWSWCTGCVHSCEARCGLPCKGGAQPCCDPPVISKPRWNLSIAAENDELHQLWSVPGPSPHQNRRIGASDETKASIIQHSLTHTKAMTPPLE